MIRALHNARLCECVSNAVWYHLDAVLMVVGQMWQWWLVFSQRVVARVGVVLVVTMWNICRDKTV